MTRRTPPESCAAADFVIETSQQFPVDVVKTGPVKIGRIDAWRVQLEGSGRARGVTANVTFIPYRGATYRITGVSPSSVAGTYTGRMLSTARSTGTSGRVNSAGTRADWRWTFNPDDLTVVDTADNSEGETVLDQRTFRCELDFDESPCVGVTQFDPDAARWALVTCGGHKGGTRYRSRATQLDAMRHAAAWLDRRYRTVEVDRLDRLEAEEAEAGNPTPLYGALMRDVFG